MFLGKANKLRDVFLLGSTLSSMLITMDSLIELMRFVTRENRRSWVTNNSRLAATCRKRYKHAASSQKKMP